MSWIAEAKARAPFEPLLEAAGLRQERGGWVPCPECGAEQRGSSDRRAAVAVYVDRSGERRLRCLRCDFRADALTLAAIATVGEPHPEDLAPVREWLERQGWLSSPGRALPKVTPKPPPPPRHPPQAEVEALWAGAVRVLDDAQAVAWLSSRALNPALVEDLDLARALPAGRLPSWARYRRRSWAESGHRLLVPLFDHRGVMRSMQARAVAPAERKSLNPAGHQVGGLVMACPLAQQLLAGASVSEVLVVEGVPDFLTWASRWGLDMGIEDAPAVIGMAAGGWTLDVAARVPDGSRVVVGTHKGDADGTGDRYAEQVARTLGHRCDVRRAGW